MPAARYPFVLTDRLDKDAFVALTEMADDARETTLAGIDTRFSVMTATIDGRFAAMQAAIDGRFAAMQAAIDGRFAAFEAAIEGRFAVMTEHVERRLAEELGKVRVEINGIRSDMAEQRADLYKWAMVFWVSQAAAVAGIVAVLR